MSLCRAFRFLFFEPEIGFASSVIPSSFSTMPTEFKSLEAQALALPPEDRERLASHLFKSLSSTTLSPSELEWLELSERRYQALKTGEDPGMSESEFFAAMN